MRFSNTITFVRQNRLILPLYLPSVIFSAVVGMLVPVLPLYIATFEVSYSMIGILVGGEALGTLIGDVPAGVLLRRMSKRRAMTIGISGAVLSTVALFWLQSIWLVFICRIISGFCIALTNIARHAYLADTVQITRRGRAIAIYGGTFRIESFIGPTIGGTLAAAFSLRAPFLAFGVGGILALVFILFFLPQDKPAESPFKTPVKSNHFIKTLKQNYIPLLNAGTGQLFAQMIRAGRVVLIPLYSADVLNLGVEQIGLIVSLSAALDVMMFLPAGYLMDKFGRKAAIIPCFTIQAVGMALIPFTASFWGLAAVTGLIGFGNGLGSGTMMTIGSDLAPPDSRSEFLGIWRLIGDGGFTGGPILVGTIADIVALPLAALMMSGAGFIAAGIFAFRVPETLKKKKEPRDFKKP